MKVIYKSRLLQSLQRWYNKATLLYHRFLLLYHYYVEIVMQSNLQNFSAYIITHIIHM